MENEAINLTNLICDSLNSIFFQLFSSIDSTIYYNLDNILFIQPTILENSKFQQLIGSNYTGGLLLIANSLILGVLLFYILKFAFSHLVYSKIDSPFQFIFKCITFIACMHCSIWLCEKLIYIIYLISDSICELGSSVNGCEITFYNLITDMNERIYDSVETFNIFSVNGLLKFVSSIGILYILIIYTIRYILCQIFVLLSPFAFISLIYNNFDGFFKGWLKQFLILLSMQIFVSITLVLGFSLEFNSNDILSKFIYLAIILIIAKCHYHTKELFSYIYQYSNNKLKQFI